MHSPLIPITLPIGLARPMMLARRRLLGMVQGAARETDEGFVQAYTRLVAAVEATFRQEESLLEKAGCDAVRDTRREHALLLNALHRAAPRVEAGGLSLGREVVAALDALLSPCRFGLPLPPAAGIRPHHAPPAHGRAAASGAHAR